MGVTSITLSVIIPVFNGGDTLRQCLQAIKTSTYTPLELIVVDDGSDDASVVIAREYGAHIFHTERRASGPAAARNLGADHAKGDILFFTDADCCVNSDALARVAALFEGENAPNAAIGSYDLHPGAPNFLSQYKNLLHAYVHQSAATEASTFWGGCGAIRRVDFLALDGFDAKRFSRPSVEDIDLGYRLKRAGGRILLDKALLVTHLKTWTVVSLLRTDIRDRGIVWTRLLLRYGEFNADLNLQSHNRVSVALTYLLLLGLVAMLISPWLGLISLGSAIGLFILNADVYAYFAKQRGIGFAIRCIFWHWLYYFYNGISFMVGSALHVVDVMAGDSAPATNWTLTQATETTARDFQSEP